jgi:hypothetical protein
MPLPVDRRKYYNSTIHWLEHPEIAFNDAKQGSGGIVPEYLPPVQKFHQNLTKRYVHEHFQGFISPSLKKQTEQETELSGVLYRQNRRVAPPDEHSNFGGVPSRKTIEKTIFENGFDREFHQIQLKKQSPYYIENKNHDLVLKNV